MIYSIDYDFKGTTQKLNVRDRVSTFDVDDIVENIADVVFDDGKYKPARFDYFYWSWIIGSYTDFDLTSVTVDELASIIDMGISKDTFLGEICQFISPVQRERIRTSALELIDTRLGEHPLAKICEDIHVVLDEVKKIVRKISEDETYLPAFAKMIGVDENMFKNLIEAMSKIQ